MPPPARRRPLRSTLLRRPRGPLDAWLPPLLVAALIFTLSSFQNPEAAHGAAQFVVRKLGHMGIYAALALGLWRAFGWRRARLAFVLVVAYAISDELHQSRVPSRHGAATDVLIDAIGAALALVLGGRWAARAAAPEA